MSGLNLDLSFMLELRCSASVAMSVSKVWHCSIRALFQHLRDQGRGRSGREQGPSYGLGRHSSPRNQSNREESSESSESSNRSSEF